VLQVREIVARGAFFDWAPDIEDPEETEIAHIYRWHISRVFASNHLGSRLCYR